MSKTEKRMTEGEKRNLKMATRCIHAGKGIDKETKAVRRPIVMANSYKLPDDPETLPEPFAWDHPEQFQYPRWRNPNARYLEERLAAIEGGEDCMVTASGVSAITSTFFTLLNAGDHIVSSNVCYIAIRDLLVTHLGKRYGVEYTLVDTSDLDAVKKAIRPNTKIVHIETPANPVTSISDIEAISQIAKQVGATVTVDGTYSGMTTQNPFKYGADISLHSCSKYINGHGDALGGAIIGKKELITRCRANAMVHLGCCISPFNAWLIMRGIVTLPLRMKKHSENAMKVAQFLESHPKIEFVRYPGLESHPQHEIAKKQMKGFSGMMNFRLKADTATHYEFLKQLKIIIHAVCLGHDESLVMFYPQEGDQPELEVLNYPEDVGRGFFRFSVGLEDTDDLIADIEQALCVVKSD